MFVSFFKSKKWAIWAYGGSGVILVSLYFQVKMTTFINEWYGEFYNILQEATKHDIADFYNSMSDFLWIAFPYIILGMGTNYFTRLYVLRWREAITFHYMPKWRAVEEEIEGSSQRIQEDMFRFARIVESLGLQVVRAIMTLIAFIPILWGLSQHLDLPVLQFLNTTDGALVYISLLVSLGGLVISWFVGVKLPHLEYNNQKVEAAFRKELVYAEDDKKNYGALETIGELFLGIRYNYHRLYLHYGYFDLWVISYGQVMIIVPYLLMAHGLFKGAFALGVLVQTSNAFAKVHHSFSLFIDNWTTITELRSVVLRLTEFEDNIEKYTKAENRSAQGETLQQEDLTNLAENKTLPNE